MTKTDSYSQGFSNPAGLSRTGGGLINTEKIHTPAFLSKKGQPHQYDNEGHKNKGLNQQEEDQCFQGMGAPPSYERLPFVD